jgi:hypothetical protein
MAKGKKGKRKLVKLKDAPPGTYDIGLDAAQRAAERGYGNLLGDLKLGRRRSATDFGLAQTDIGRQKTEFGQDIATQRGDVERQYKQTLDDLLSQRQGIERNYGRLGNQQRQAFQSAGLSEGGAGQQAAAKRATNLAIEERPLDVAKSRATEARSLSLNDLLRQQNRATDPTTGAFARALGQVGLNYQRGGTDAARTQTQAHDELLAYRSDLGKTRMQEYLEGGGRRKVSLGPKQRKRYRKLGVI